MKSKLLVSLGLGALILGASQMANAGVSIGLNLAVPPVYVAPAPVYVAPAPVYVAPAPLYAPPPMVAYQPVPVVATSFVIGWHAGQYWDGRRWWSRHDWYAHRHW